jgi:DHA1 family bicyclomycin/chloramphenicol resistance-like MFS transporter
MNTPSTSKAQYIGLISYCGILSSLGAFSVDSNLPSLGIMAKDFHVSPSHMTLTITLFVWALGIGQGLWGFASDRFGRKPIIFSGLVIFIVGCLIATFTTSLEWLLFGRIIQGFGIAVGPVISRAILRDSFSGTQLSQSIALSTAIFSLGPIIAPLIGAFIAESNGWRAIFLALSLVAIAFSITTLFVKETIPFIHKDAISPQYIASISSRLFSCPQSKFYTLLCTFVWFFFLSALANIPRLFEQFFNITGTSFAYLFALFGISIIAGQLVNHKLISIIGTEKAALLATLIMTVATLITLALSSLAEPSFLLLVSFTTALTFSYPILLVTATTLTLQPHGDVAGGISSLFGFFYQTVAALLASILALFQLPFLPWLSVILFSSTLCFIALLLRIYYPKNIPS